MTRFLICLGWVFSTFFVFIAFAALGSAKELFDENPHSGVDFCTLLFLGLVGAAFIIWRIVGADSVVVRGDLDRDQEDDHE